MKLYALIGWSTAGRRYAPAQRVTLEPRWPPRNCGPTSTKAFKAADGPFAAALKRDLADLDQTLKSITAPSGAGAGVAPRLSEIARLENAALTGVLPGPDADALRAAFRRWREATASYDLADLESAGAALAKAIDERVLTRIVRKSGNYREPSYYRARIDAAVRTLSRSKPSEEATKAFHALEAAITATNDPALTKIWREQIFPSVSGAPHTWDKLANVIDGIGILKASNKAAIEAAVDRIKGVLGEMVSLSAPAYRDALIEATRHADQVAATLNLRALRAAQKAGKAADFNPPYRVLFPQFDLRAPGASGKGLWLFFDDAVLVVNDATIPPEAFVVFASQVKAGDAATAGAVEQMISDQARLLKGRIAIGSTEYDLRPRPDIGAVTRVFVGTKTPPGTAALSGRIRLVKGPVDGISLAQFAEFALKAAAKIK